MSTSYTSRPTTAEVVVHATKFCLRSFFQAKRPFSILDELPAAHNVRREGWEQYEAWAADGADPAPVTTSRPAALARPSCGGAEFPLSPSPGLAVKRATRTKSHPALGGSPPSVAMQEDEALAPSPQFRTTLQSQPTSGLPGGGAETVFGSAGQASVFHCQSHLPRSSTDSIPQPAPNQSPACNHRLRFCFLETPPETIVACILITGIFIYKAPYNFWSDRQARVS